jgi:hypothetical protein
LLAIFTLMVGTFAVSPQRAEAVPDGPGEWVGSISIAKSDISGFYNTYLVTTTWETVAGGAYGATVMDARWDGTVDWTRHFTAPCDGVPTGQSWIADYGESDEGGTIRIEWKVSDTRWLMKPDPGTNYIIDGNFLWVAGCDILGPPFPEVFDNELVPAFSVFDEGAPQDTQVLVGTAEIENGTAPYTAEWRFWRADCDETVDSDGGGEGDCEEARNGRDPFNSSDDVGISVDADGDGVLDADDLCSGTDLAGDTNPDVKRNRLWSNASGMFAFGDGTDSGITVADTGGCSASQVIEAAGLGRGHVKFGISKSALATYLANLT